MSLHDVDIDRVAEGLDPDPFVAESLGYLAALRAALLHLPNGYVPRLNSTDCGITGCLSGAFHHARTVSPGDGGAINGIAAVAPTDGVFDPLHGHMDIIRAKPRMLILDLDGSCGGGTASLIATHSYVHQCDIAVNDIDAYECTPSATLRVVTDATRYLDVLRVSLEECGTRVEAWRRQRLSTFCVYSAGVDGFESADRGLAGMTAELLRERDRIVFEWCLRMEIRTAYMLGCGHATEAMPMDVLVALHRQTIETAVAVMREHATAEAKERRTNARKW